MLAWWVVGSLVAAAPEPVRWEYALDESARDCPNGTEVRELVAARLGVDPFRPEAPRTLRVLLTRRGAEHHAVVELIEDERVVARRELSAKSTDCRELMGPLTLAVALAIDPLGELAAPAPAAPAPPEPAPPAPPVVETPAPAPPPPPAVQPSAWVALTGALGVTPAPAVGVRVGGELSWSKVRFGLEGEALLSWAQTGAVPFRAEGGLARLLGCVPLGRFAVCVDAAGGALHVSGGRVDPTAAVSPLVYAGLRGVGRWSFSNHLALLVALDVDAQLLRPSLLLADDTVWRAPVVAGRLAVGLAWLP